jgi:murein DD-endopeptidase MepM/ murein hydrolase activator NlpD
VVSRLTLVVALAASSLLLSAAAPPRGATAVAPGSAESSAYGVQVIVAGAAGGSAAVVSAPPDASATGSFVYPADGSVVQAGSASATAATAVGNRANARSSADVSSLSLFGGEITLSSAAARATATAKGKEASGDVSASSVSGLVALGQAVSSSPGASVALADWGSATVLEQSSAPENDGDRPGYRVSVLALRVRVTKEHGGLPAGSEILVGYSEAFAQARAAPPDPVAPAKTKRRPRTTTKATTTRATTTTVPTVTPRPAIIESIPTTPRPRRAREPGRDRPELPLKRRRPPALTPPLTAGGYVFPVHGPTAWGDTFGAPRAAPVGWHHGADIFAPVGAPVLAVAAGTLFSIGWNDLGGYRLWLRDRDGNEFYYAHLSAFSTLAVEGSEVKAGDVIGFVGATGDAEGTSPHLHFEIHPVSLQWMEYDGAVNPTKYLRAWQTLRDVPIVGVAGWAPPIAPASRAPRPGAILLQMTDISSASGLDPGSLRRVLQAPRSVVSADGFATLRPPAADGG